MAILFPGALDDFENPAGAGVMAAGGGAVKAHSQLLADIHDAVEALEAKVGVDDSAATTSQDYRIAALEAALAALSIPAGLIAMWAGTITGIPAGWALCDGTNGTPDLRDKFVKGAAAAADAGATGDGIYTPTGIVSTPTFVGDSVSTSSVSAGTPAGTNSVATFTGTLATLSHAGTAVANHVFTQPTIAWPAGVPTAANESSHTHSVTSNVSGTLTPTGTIAWPANPPTHSGTAISDHTSHTHTYTDVVNHVHPGTAFTDVASALTGGSTTHYQVLSKTTDTSSTASDFVPPNTANPTGGVATGTTAGPNAALTHTVSNQGTIAYPANVPIFTGTSSQALSMVNPAVTSGAGSAHTHTLSWPAGVPTNSGGAVDAHAITQPNDHSYTPAGTNSAATFTGSALGTHSHTVTATGTIGAITFTGDEAAPEPAYYAVLFVMKL